MAKERILKRWRVSDSLKNLPTINSLIPKPLQGSLKDLDKKNYDRLKNNIFKRGFTVPLFIWQDQTGDGWIIDGHQRQIVINKEWPAGKDVPYVLIEAENEQDAKLQLLAIDSKFGRSTKDGFDEFTAEFGDISEYIEIYTGYGEFLDVEIEADAEPDGETDTKSEDQDPDNDESEPIFKIEVLFDNEKEMQGVLQALEDQGYECKATVTGNI